MSIVVTLDQEYGVVGGVHLLMDIYQPAELAGPYPVVLAIHGGLNSPQGKQGMSPICSQLAENGMVSISIAYREAPTYPWPALHDDQELALTWLLDATHAATWLYDPTRVGIVGGSLGGGWSELLAAEQGKPTISAVCAWSGPINFHGYTHLSGPFPQSSAETINTILGCYDDPPNSCANAQDASAILAVNAATMPPVRLAHSQADPVCPFSQSVQMETYLTTLGVTHEFQWYSGTRHSLQLYNDEIGPTVAFFMKYLQVNIDESNVPVPPAFRLPRTHQGVAHVFESASNTRMLPFVDSYSAEEEAPGGFMSAQGRISVKEFRDRPELWADGTIWRVVDIATNEIEFAGWLATPQIEGNYVQLSARGWGQIPLNTVDRLPYAIVDYGQWSPASSDPYAFTNTESDSIQPSSEGQLKYEVPRSTDITTGDEAIMVLSTPGIPISRITFDVKLTGGTSSDYDFKVRTGLFPDGTLANVATVSFGSAPGHQDVSFTGEDDAVGIGLRRSTAPGGGATSAAFTARAKNVVTYGIGFPNESCSDLVKDVCARLGVGISDVSQDDVEAVPYDQQGGTFMDALLWACALADSRACIRDLGAGPSMDYGTWDKQSWIVDDPHAEVDALPLPIFNVVRVPFTYGNTSIVRMVEVRADPDPLAYDNIFTLDLQQPAATQGIATTLATSVVGVLSRLRFGGRFRLSEVLDPFTGYVVSARRMHAGDTIYFPKLQQSCRIATLHRESVIVEGDLDDGMAIVRQLTAAQSQLAH